MLAPLSTPTDIEAPAAASAAAPAISVRGLVKTFGGARALDGISLALPAGELTALIGANGSGKSTLLKILFGIADADAGEVRALGLDPRRDREKLRALTGYVGQDAALDPEMTGWETLRLFYALRGLPHHERNARLERLAEEYGIESFSDRPVATYSGGERQRLHLALEAMHDPHLLLFDEPTASLDPSGRRSLWSRLAAWRDAGHTLLIATHDLPEVAAYCDRVILLEHGNLLAADSPGALIAAHSRASTVITLTRGIGRDGDELLHELRALPGSPDVNVGGGMLTLWRERNPDGSEPALEILAAHGISYLRIERNDPDLAGAYFRLTGSTLGPAPAQGRGRGKGRGGR